MVGSFDALAHDVQQRRLRSLADDVLARYDLPVHQVRLLQFEDNAVYRVEAGEHAYVLRVSVVDGRSAAAQASELAWLAAITEEKAAVVPAPVLTTSADRVVSTALDGVPVTAVLFEWVHGDPTPTVLTPRLAGELGRVTARLHEHSAVYVPPAGFVRPSWGPREVFDEGATTTALARSRLDGRDRDLLAAVSATVRDRMPPPGTKGWGLIHADLHRGNVVVTPGGEVAVIDFDDCGWGHHMLDVATMLSSILRICLDDRDTYARLAGAYLDGYVSVRALPPSAHALDEFLVLRDMIILNFMLGSRNAAVLEYAPRRAAGILALMRRYLETGAYDGHVPLTA